jgi:ActR/RegA family two-component response regulator
LHKKQLRNILVIEPDPDLCRALTRKLSRNVRVNFSVVTSNNHETGLTLLKGNPDFYDIVIVNLGRSVPLFMDFIGAARKAIPQAFFVLFTGSTAEIPPEAKLDAIIRGKDPQALIDRISIMVAPRR